MYTNPTNIMRAMTGLLELNMDTIECIIQKYEDQKTLHMFEGLRDTLPVSSFPSMEVEPTSTSNEWATLRSQRPKHSFNCTLTFKVSKIELGVEYVTTVTNTIVEILTSPENLQLKVPNEQKWEPNMGLVDTYIMDSFIDSVTWKSNKEGSIRVAEFEWTATIHEPFPDSKFNAAKNVNGELEHPTLMRPIERVPE